MKLIKFLRDTRAELTHVNWPSRQHTILFTVVVILVSVIVGYLLGGFDFLFKLGLRSII